MTHTTAHDFPPVRQQLGTAQAVFLSDLFDAAHEAQLERGSIEVAVPVRGAEEPAVVSLEDLIAWARHESGPLAGVPQERLELAGLRLRSPDGSLHWSASRALEEAQF